MPRHFGCRITLANMTAGDGSAVDVFVDRSASDLLPLNHET